MKKINLKKISKFLPIFQKEMNKRIRQKDINQVSYNNLIKLNKKMIKFKDVIHFAISKNFDFFNALKELKLLKLKSTFYRYIKKIRLWSKYKNLDHFFLKSTRPKTIKYKYDKKIRTKISNLYFNKYHNLLITFYYIKKLPECLKISLNTISKIVKTDNRYLKAKNKLKTVHDLRNYDLGFGNIQMDLKIIGAKQSPTKKRITIFDAKDEQSKLVFIQVIKDASLPNLLLATKNMIKYFENKLGMKINRIRTDNAMCFKQSNYVKSYAYSELLREHNIKQEFIPLKQPECNGVIERHHRTVDAEFLPKIKPNYDHTKIKKLAKKFMYFHNFERPHFYSFLDKKVKEFIKKIWIPFEFYKKHLRVQKV